MAFAECYFAFVLEFLTVNMSIQISHTPPFSLEILDGPGRHG